MLFPKKVKHRKWHKGRVRGAATRKINLSFGTFGLKSLEARWITSRQLEAARRTITRQLKRGGKLWIRVFPDRPVTFKGLEVTMGGGKGAVDHYVVAVQPGTMLFELDGVDLALAQVALRMAAHKLPVKTKFIQRNES